MAAAAFGLAPGDLGNFSDAGAVAHALSDNMGHTVGALFAILLLDASLIGANAVGLATTYTLATPWAGGTRCTGRSRKRPCSTSATRCCSPSPPPSRFSPDNVLGLLTQGVQALAGVLLPSATVFLVLLCNDKAVLGPW